MTTTIVKTSKGDIAVLEPPYTREELAIMEKSLYSGSPRTIARIRPETPQQNPQEPQPQKLPQSKTR